MLADIKRCEWCKHYDEHFDCFGHLLQARCKDSGKYVKHNSSCINFEHREESFFTDINDDD